jgi:hypothetical protein
MFDRQLVSCKNYPSIQLNVMLPSQINEYLFAVNNPCSQKTKKLIEWIPGSWKECSSCRSFVTVKMSAQDLTARRSQRAEPDLLCKVCEAQSRGMNHVIIFGIAFRYWSSLRISLSTRCVATMSTETFRLSEENYRTSRNFVQEKTEQESKRILLFTRFVYPKVQIYADY